MTLFLSEPGSEKVIEELIETLINFGIYLDAGEAPRVVEEV